MLVKLTQREVETNGHKNLWIEADKIFAIEWVRYGAVVLLESASRHILESPDDAAKIINAGKSNRIVEDSAFPEEPCGYILIHKNGPASIPTTDGKVFNFNMVNGKLEIGDIRK